MSLMSTENRWARRGLSLLAGFLVCFAMPPWGWWPLAIIGVALWGLLLDGRTTRQRFWVGVMVGESWYLPSTLWMVKFSPAGWPLGVAVWFPLVLGLVSMACPPRHTLIALPGAVVLGEWFRWHAPFGGVPLSILAFTQGRGPLLGIARIGGTLAVSGAVATVGAALAALTRPGARRGGVIALSVVAVLVALSVVAPDGVRNRVIVAATVQGGGPQGIRSTGNESGVVLDRHTSTALKVRTPVDLVVLPENIANVNGFYEGSYEQERISSIATTLHTTVVAGAVEDRGDPRHFWNFAVAVEPDGRQVDRYDKVRRVPFGEYVPMRPLFDRVAKSILPPRDDREGNGTPVLHTSLGRLGVVISWEVFFPRRVRHAMHHDAQIMLNPTNGSSYWLNQVQTQQIASSTLRAVESGRWMLQAAPTGFSAIIDQRGVVHQRSAMGEARVLQQKVELRDGRTLAMWWGEAPALVASVFAIAGAWLFVRRRRTGESTQEPALPSEHD